MPRKFHYIESILRSGSKYDITYLRRCAIKILQRVYPRSLTEYKATPTLHIQYEWTKSQEIALSVVALAERFDIPSILPTSMMKSCYPRNELLSQYLPQSVVPLETQRTILLGRFELYKEQQVLMKSLTGIHATTPGCTGEPQSRCNMGRIQMYRSHQPVPAFATPEYPHPSPQLCANCLKIFNTQYQRGLSQIWDRLPAMFNLQSWEELPRDHEDDEDLPHYN